mgnify:FL=1
MKNMDVLSVLEERGYSAEITEKVSNGVEMEGIIISNGKMGDEGIYPVIYTSDLIAEAEMYGKSAEYVADQVIEILNENQCPDFNIDLLQNKRWLLAHMYIGIQKESAEDIIREKCEKMPGLEKYLYIKDVIGDDVYTLKITDWLLIRSDIEYKEAWKMAERNTFNETRIISMGQVMAELLHMEYSPDMECGLKMYVVSNEMRSKGASAILDEEALFRFTRTIGVRRVIVIPSSIHEMLIVPVEEGISVDDITPIVKEVNETMVIPEERLTDTAYVLEV